MASSNRDLIQSILSIALYCSIDMISVNYVIKEEEPGSIIIYENHINPPSSKETHIRFDFVMNTLAERGYFILKVFQFATEYVRSRATDRTQFIPCCKITDIKYAECDKLIHLSKESPIWVELRPPLKVLEQLLVDDYYAKHRDEIVAHMLAEEKRDKIER